MKSSRSIWTPTPSNHTGTPRRAKTPNRVLPSQFQNHSMFANDMRYHRGSINYKPKRKNMNFSGIMPVSMDPQAFQRFEHGGTYTQNTFNPEYVQEDQFRGVLNRFSLSRVNNK